MKEMAIKHGLDFEKQTDIKTKLFQQYTKEELSHLHFVEKHKFNKFCIDKWGVSPKKIWSANLLPDEAIYNENTNHFIIIEKKYQACPGSVDEKLQTCGFKLSQYKKIAKLCNFTIEYIYFLNDWFLNKRYDDVKEYILSQGCKYYIENLPLKLFFERGDEE